MNVMKSKCPICDQIFDNKIVKCPKCNWDLISITDTEAEKENKFNKRFSIAICLFFVISVIIVGSAFFKSDSSNQSGTTTYLSDVRCSWCSKVIRANGRNIHGHITSFSDEFLECEYCGHNTRITK